MKKAMKQSTLIFIFNAVSICLLIFIAIAFAFTSLKSNAIDRANQNRLELTDNATRFFNASSYLTNEVRAYAATKNQQNYDNYWNEANTLKNRETSVSNMKEIGISAQEEALISQMSALSNQLMPLEERAMELTAVGNRQSALTNVYGAEYLSGIGQIDDLKSQFLTALGQRTQSEIDSLTTQVRVLQVVTYVLILCIILFQITNFVVVRRRVVKPLIAIEAEMGHMAAGNLGSRFDLVADTSEIGMVTHSIQETKRSMTEMIGDLSRGLQEMARGNFNIAPSVEFKGDFITLRDSIATILVSLSQTLQQINQVSSQVSTDSEQVSAGAQTLSQGSTEQSHSVEQLAISIDQVSRQVKDTANYSAQASQKADLVGAEVAESNQQMQSMLTAMHNISVASGEISKIIKTIEDIAFQTNILALNAAVEAARAGEAGKGFAVVADEVRNLASKSAEASKGTSQLISNSLRAVDDGTKIADDTAHMLNTVVDSVREVVSTINLISTASQKQAQSIVQISTGIDQISAVVQTNSATAQESAAASQELSGQAQMLKSLVDRFQVLDLDAQGAMTSSEAETESAAPQKTTRPAPAHREIPRPAPAPRKSSAAPRQHDGSKY